MAVDGQSRLEPYTGTATAVLTVVSLLLVFSAVLGYVPEQLLPHDETLVAVIPHVNVLISVTAIGTILAGVRAIRRGKVARHRRAMLASTVLFGTFLVLYLYRLSLEGTTPFEGPDLVYQFVYLPMLAIHILFAIICLPFVYYALLLAWTKPLQKLRDSAHARVGRVAAFLWAISFAFGIGIYAMLRVVF